jgi:hypothetical protein
MSMIPEFTAALSVIGIAFAISVTSSGDVVPSAVEVQRWPHLFQAAV